MWNRFGVALLIGLVALPCTSLVCRADDTQASSEKECCCKNKDGQCTKCKGVEGKCTKCQCENCDNPDCDKENCTCGENKKTACQCTEKGCKDCDEAECHFTAATVTACNEAGCAAGKCCKGSYCAQGDCTHEECLTCPDTLAFGAYEQSLFGSTTHWQPSAVGDAMWQHLVASDSLMCTEQPVLFNDRVCVQTVAASEVLPHPITEANRSCTTCTTAVPATSARLERHAENGSPAQILYSIQIIEDSRGCMEEYDALREGAPMMFVESKSLLPAIRMLAKNDLVKQTTSPKIICTAGQTAELQIDNACAEKLDGMRLEVAGEETEAGLKIELAMHAVDDQRNIGVRTALLVEHGQTIVVNATAGPGRQQADEEKPAVYIVVTPEILQ